MITLPRPSRPSTCPGSPGFLESRNHRTSMGAPRSCTSSPAFARTVELRPSQPMTRSARTSSGPSGVAAWTPATRPPLTTRSVTSACILTVSAGKARECSTRKSRKSHWGMKAMNRAGPGIWEKSATLKLSPPTSAEMASTCEWGRCRKACSRPSSCRMSRVDGCTVSPRKSLRKSPCFSSTTVRTPARPRRWPSIIPAGPLPAMQHWTFIGSAMAALPFSAPAKRGREPRSGGGGEP